MGRTSHRNCVICGKQESQPERMVGSKFFASFPLDEIRCKEWLRAVGIEDLAYMPIEKLNERRHICGDHFGKSHFNKKMNRLKKVAVPKLQLSSPPLTDKQLQHFPLHTAAKNKTVPIPDAPMASTSKEHHVADPVLIPDRLMPSASKAPLIADPKLACSVRYKPDASLPSTSKEHLVADVVLMPDTSMPSTSRASLIADPKLELTPRKKELLEKLRQTKCTLSSLKKSAKLIERIEPPMLKDIVESALKNQNKKPQGRRWTSKNKISSLAIFKRSPKVYRYLKQIIPLPSEKLLQNILKEIPMEPGINALTLKHLKKIAPTQSTGDKLCVLAFDEIALKPHLIYNSGSDKVEGYVDYGDSEERGSDVADHALVFLIQGLRKKFKQPIAFYFVKGTVASQKLANIIKEIK